MKPGLPRATAHFECARRGELALGAVAFRYVLLYRWFADGRTEGGVRANGRCSLRLLRHPRLRRACLELALSSRPRPLLLAGPQHGPPVSTPLPLPSRARAESRRSRRRQRRGTTPAVGRGQRRPPHDAERASHRARTVQRVQVSVRPAASRDWRPQQ